MEEFTKVYSEGYTMDSVIYHTNTIMRCKNIDFGHINWFSVPEDFYNNTKCIMHIVDNIIDINAHDNNCKKAYTFFTKIIQYSSEPHIIHYMLNNSYISSKCFEIYFNFPSIFNEHNHVFCKCCPHKRFDKPTYYLTKVSLNRFKGYYNIEKYYDIIHTMLLIMKAQHKIPAIVIKHLIIPFIYQ